MLRVYSSLEEPDRTFLGVLNESIYFNTIIKVVTISRIERTDCLEHSHSNHLQYGDCRQGERYVMSSIDYAILRHRHFQASPFTAIFPKDAIISVVKTGVDVRRFIQLYFGLILHIHDRPTIGVVCHIYYVVVLVITHKYELCIRIHVHAMHGGQ